ncbi:Centromere protein V [Lachnellula suecica]|uniref:Centromere protein V n=1 Tax=Lachnellula suecica TaxID=602035 RepID=A0A8T9CDS8_9HELO|nr:Centromere protein V [Lachnellula suecica]
MPPKFNPTFSTATPLSFDHIITAEDTSPTERTTHTGACQCGAVQYTVTLKHPFPKYPVNACSCSMCTRNGYLFVYPKRKDFEITQGEDNLTSYTFNSHTRPHMFCKTCGSSLLIDFRKSEQGETDPRKDIIALNVRNFVGIDLDALEYTYFDGRNLIPTMEKE